MAQSTAVSVINRHRTQSADHVPIINLPPVTVTKTPARSFPGHPHLLLKSHSKNVSEGKTIKLLKLQIILIKMLHQIVCFIR